MYPRERYVDSSFTEPNWLDDFKVYARIDFPHHDDLISSHLASARDWFERQTGIITVTRIITLTLDTFPCEVIEVKRTPATSIASVGYADTAGNSQTWSSSKYVVDLGDATHFCRIMPTETETYPLTDDGLADVTITFVAGHATAEAVPRQYRDAIFGYAEDLYNRMPGPSEMTLAKLATCGGWMYA